jgi:predicted nucleic-acid-binding Zn-ribbon protein
MSDSLVVTEAEDGKLEIVNPLTSSLSPEVKPEDIQTGLIGDETPKVKNCPKCGAALEDNIKAVAAGKKMHVQGKAYRAVVSFCKKCGQELGFMGLTPAKSAYHDSPLGEHKKREKRKAAKSARKRNRG